MQLFLQAMPFTKVCSHCLAVGHVRRSICTDCGNVPMHTCIPQPHIACDLRHYPHYLWFASLYTHATHTHQITRTQQPHIACDLRHYPHYLWFASLSILSSQLLCPCYPSHLISFLYYSLLCFNYVWNSICSLSTIANVNITQHYKKQTIFSNTLVFEHF